MAPLRSRRAAHSSCVLILWLPHAPTQFVAAIVHVAVNRREEIDCVEGGVSEALRSLLTEVLEPHTTGRLSLPEPNAFRRTYCYTREVNDMLLAHEKGLRRLFYGLESADHTDIAWHRHGHVLGLDEWMSLLRSLELVGEVRDACRSTHDSASSA